jgi:flagellar hook-associated protein 3 FlgL
MRITTNMLSDQIINNLNIDLARIADVNKQVSTGKRINQPSDDPLGAQRVVNLNEAIAQIDQYKRNTDYINNWVATSESSLSEVVSSLSRARTLAMRGANDATLSQDELNALADDIDGILKNVLQLSNSTLEGKSIFAGAQTNTESFTAVLAAGEIVGVNYNGDSFADQVEIETNEVVNKNIPGNSIFQPGAGIDVFSTLINLRDNLRAGNQAAVNASIGELETAHQQVATQVSFLGNKVNRLEITGENLSEKKLGLVKLNSQLADTDMPEAIVRLQTGQDVFSAALQSSSRILDQQRLMDFLG